MLRRTVLVVTCSAMLGGCASWTNYTAPIDLRKGSVSIDVKQRVVFSQERNDITTDGAKTTERKRTVVCAEPSPDALTVIGASGGLSLNSGKGQAANAALAIAEQGASIGLRTQSIQLLRDAMYRLCEGYAAGSISDADFASMQRRYQSTMMGLIAIEQLTGPVVAAQAAVSSRVSSSAGAGAGDAAVDKAQEKQNAAEDEVLNAEKAFAIAKQATADKTKALSKAQSDLHTETKKKKEDQSQASIDALNSQIPTLQRELDDVRIEEADKRRRLDLAVTRRNDAQNALKQAMSKVSAGAEGTSAIAAGYSAANTASFANAVFGIVTEINSSYLRDSCVTLMTTLITDRDLIGRLKELDNEDKTKAAEGKPVDKTSAVAVVRTNLSMCQEILSRAANKLKNDETSQNSTNTDVNSSAPGETKRLANRQPPLLPALPVAPSVPSKLPS